MTATAQSAAALLEARNLELVAPSGRPLIRSLNLSLGTEQAAIIGRNGVGKSTLLEALADGAPTRGRLIRRTTPELVPQTLTESHRARGIARLREVLRSRLRDNAEMELAAAGLPEAGALVRRADFSPGELRKLCLVIARVHSPELLLLDEPTRDLDERGVRWLVDWLSGWTSGLLVVSHERQLLSLFEHFMLIAESGCRYLPGSLSEVEATLEREQVEYERKYLRRLSVLEQQEAKSEKFRLRRERKGRGGRVRELGRCTPRSVLNKKRSYAQEKQGRIEATRSKRIEATRGWAKAARRALSVNLPLDAVLPELPEPSAAPVVQLRDASAHADGRRLFEGLDLTVSRERVAVIGPTGAGKSTLLRMLTGAQEPQTGRARRDYSRIGSIAQGATDWMSDDSLIEKLAWSSDVASPEAAARLLTAHGFPLALAERPLSSLSPGERVRAALICLLERRPAIELLILDEPVSVLDFVGAAALRRVLRAWKGGLVVASHDQSLLDAIRIDRTIELGNPTERD